MVKPQRFDEMHLLCLLYNIGATESGKTLTVKQFSEWAETDISVMHFLFQKLVELGYVQFIQGTDKFHLTLDGISKGKRLAQERVNARMRAWRESAELKDQLGRGAITEEEYEQKEKELLKKAWDPT